MLGPYCFLLYHAYPCMKCSLDISNFLEEMSGLSHSPVFLKYLSLFLKSCTEFNGLLSQAGWFFCCRRRGTERMVVFQVSSRLPTESSWLHTEKNSRGSPHEGKADLIWEIHAPQIKNRLSQKARGLSVGLVSFYGLCNFINWVRGSLFGRAGEDFQELGYCPFWPFIHWLRIDMVHVGVLFSVC